jgi:hypothetical protein
MGASESVRAIAHFLARYISNGPATGAAAYPKIDHALHLKRGPAATAALAVKKTL